MKPYIDVRGVHPILITGMVCHQLEQQFGNTVRNLKVDEALRVVLTNGIHNTLLANVYDSDIFIR